MPTLSFVASFGVKIAISAHSDSRSAECGMEISQTIALTLSDPDLGDYFDVEPYQDPLCGTAVFRTVAGTSSCPAETGTVPFSIQLGDGLKKQRIFSRGEEEVSFRLTVRNFSPTRDDLEAFIFVSPESNSFAAGTKVGGDLALSSDDGAFSYNAGASTMPLKDGTNNVCRSSLQRSRRSRR